MAVLLKLSQNERSVQVGVFGNEQGANAFIQTLPFVQKDTEYPESLTISYTDLPPYYEAAYNGAVFILSKFMFIPEDGDILITIEPVHLWDEPGSGVIEGITQVDAYCVPNEDVQRYIAAREKLYKEIESYAKKKGELVLRRGLGSQDGEYVTLTNEPGLYHLDPEAVALRQQCADIESFLKANR